MNDWLVDGWLVTLVGWFAGLLAQIKLNRIIEINILWKKINEKL